MTAEGACPKKLLNNREKCAGLSNPSEKQTSLTPIPAESISLALANRFTDETTERLAKRLGLRPKG